MAETSRPPPEAEPTEAPPRIERAGVRLLALLQDSRASLRRHAAVEVAAACAAGLLLGAAAALLVVGVAPFSVVLRVGLLALIAVSAAVAAAAVVRWRLLPLAHDVVVAARIEDAMRRRGDDPRDVVRGAVELNDSGVDRALGRSRALADAHIDATLVRVQRSGAASSLRGVSLERAVPTLVLLSCAVALVGGWRLLAPDSFDKRASLLFSDAGARRALDERARAAVPLVTDLVLTLRFPAYMQVRDEVIPGSSGDVSAPRGTEVTVQGRADRALKGASILIGEQEIGAAVREQQITARFVIDGDATYRFKVQGLRGGVDVDPVAHKVVAVADAAPAVTLEEPALDRVVKVDDDVDLAFSASDDVGLTRFSVVVRREGRAREPWRKDLLALPTALKEARGKGAFSVAETGARPGDRLSVVVEAWDNDTISGPKAGRSVTRVLTVFSAEEQHKKTLARLEDVLEKMVDSLGDELEARVGDDALELLAQKRAFERHAKVQERHEQTQKALADAVQVMAEDELAPAGIRRALANMKLAEDRAMDAKRASVRGVAVPLLAERPAPLGAWRRVQGDQRVLVARLEKDVLYLDDLVKMERVQQARQIADELVRAQQDMKELLAQYKETGDPAARAALLDEIKRMKEQLQQLMQQLAHLQQDLPDEYLNEEAFKGDEMMQQGQDIDRLLEEGKLDEAQQALEQMLEDTKKLVEELDKTGEEMGGDEYRELREKVERFADELDALEKAQQEQAAQSDELAEKQRHELEQKLGAKLKSTVADLKKKVEKAQTELKGLQRDVLFSNEAEDGDLAQARAEDLLRALESGDLEDATAAAEEAAGAARSAQQSVSDRSRGRFGARDAATQEARRRLEEAQEQLDDVRKKLDELMPRAGEGLDANAQKRMQRGADAQQQLSENAQQLQRLMDEIGKEAPMFGPEHKRKLDDARQQMERAARDLKGRNLRGARSAQRQAGMRLRELHKALEEQGGSGGSGGGMPMPFPSGGSPGSEPARDGEGGRAPSSDEVKIPDGSEFRVPDQYRKDILDAMRESVPDSWAGEVKKYYEELIK